MIADVLPCIERGACVDVAAEVLADRLQPEAHAQQRAVASRDAPANRVERLPGVLAAVPAPGR